MLMHSHDQAEDGFSSSWGRILISLLSSMPVIESVRQMGKLIGSVLVMSLFLSRRTNNHGELLEPSLVGGG